MSFLKRITAYLCVLSIILIAMFSFPTVSYAESSSDISIRTSLTDGAVQIGSRKTFDVWARNSSDQKIDTTVKFNSKEINKTWSDSEKTSYTLDFAKFGKSGENTVSITASDGKKSKTLNIKIIYKKANKGDIVGTSIWCVETFTIGNGYLVEPTEVPIYEGDTAADQLIRFLHENGLVAYYGGTTKSSFYMAYIADGGMTEKDFEGYKLSGKAQNPHPLNLKVSNPKLLYNTSISFDHDDYINTWEGYLGEFVFTNGSGWMYSVNNVFPNVGFADSYLSDGDVVRVQFTLALGSDIGGSASTGQATNGFYNVADKDNLTRAICHANKYKNSKNSAFKKAYTTALSAASTLDIKQSAVNTATDKLEKAIEEVRKEENKPDKKPDNNSDNNQNNNNSDSKVPENNGSGSSSVKNPNNVSSNQSSHSEGSSESSNSETNESSSESLEENTDSALSSEVTSSSDGKNDSSKPQKDKKSNKTVIIVLSVISLLAVSGGILGYIFYMKKK